MNLLFVTDLFEGKVAQSFCWMLLHSLWQGLLFTIITGIIMMLTKRSAATVRYNMIVAMFFLFIAVCVFTFIRGLYLVEGITKAPQYANTINIQQNLLSYFLTRIINYSSTHASVVIIPWFIIFCFRGLKLATALIYNNRLTGHKIATPVHWKNKMADLCEQLQIKKAVLLFESGIVKIPVVIGHLKPMIFIPAGLLTCLPAEEVEAILLHELAHIRRNDYLVNMIQVITESIFFFNPALLWMSHLLREERENCCDDIAVGHIKSKKQYIQALISFKEHAMYATGYTTAFPAGRNQLLKRVTRIVINKNNALDKAGKFFFIVSLLLSVLLLIGSNYSNHNLAEKQRIKRETLPVRSMAVINLLLEKTVRNISNIKDAAFVRKSMTRQSSTRISYSLNKQATALKQKPVTTVTGNNIITGYTAVASNYSSQAAALLEARPVYQQDGDIYKQQAEKDRLQAEKDRKQAEADRVQAQKDREQALKDMRQAALDRLQAEKDRLQADKDRQQAEKDRLHSLQMNG